jgi:acetyl-CoA carboxylase biotin carboxyl carrier protein
MNAGQLQSLKDLIEFLKQQEVGEFELEQEDLKVRLSFIGHGSAAGNVDLGQIAHLLQQAPRPAASPVVGALAASAQPAHASTPPSADSTPAAAEEAGLHIVKSPIVGTFYEASAPGAEPFVKVGDQVESGQVICIVEAMKLMNEIECDAAGEVVKRMVASGQPVEYGQALFAIRPR